MEVKLNSDHSVLIEQRSNKPHDWRARCTCGWIKYGTRAEVNNASWFHDKEQFKVEIK